MNLRLPALLLVLALPAGAQISLPEAGVLPDPLAATNSAFFPATGKPVRSLTELLDGDTLTARFFGPDGREVLEIDYMNNRPAGKLIYQYGKRTTVTRRYGGRQLQELQATQTYTYDGHGNTTAWAQTGALAGRWYYDYDAQHRLTGRYAAAPSGGRAGEPACRYRYDTAGRLAEVTERQWTTRYVYAGPRLVARNRYYTNGPAPALMAFSRYRYDTAGRILERVSEADSNQYVYAGHQLARMVSYKRDGTYEEVAFSYEQNLLQQADITTNSIYISPRFIFPGSYLLAPGTGGPARRTMTFAYDARNNIREISYFVGGNRKYRRTFCYRYD